MTEVAEKIDSPESTVRGVLNKMVSLGALSRSSKNVEGGTLTVYMHAHRAPAVVGSVGNGAPEIGTATDELEELLEVMREIGRLEARRDQLLEAIR